MASPAEIKAIFLAATEKPQAERAVYLADACGGDSALRRRVEALLKAHDNTGGWLGETATPTSDYPGFSAPSIEELAPHFPQLEILELLGQGGMGAVYKARQTNLDRLVALKILPHDAGDRGFAERFTREARTLAKLNHPGIVAVHDFGATGELYWFVMEYVDGVNLRQAKKAGTLTPAAALAVVPQICEALQFAHDAGVVHRDIKPENVLLDASGRIKIADFGLAKLVGRPDRTHLTGTHQAMGTPHYMAPEQWEKPLEVDHRADIYSLGVVFYELLTGELPLGRFAPPSQKVRVDVRLDEVVLRTLEKEPARRYQQASQLKTDVERIGSSPKFAVPPEAVHSTDRPSFFRQVLRWPLVIVFAVGVLFFSAAALSGERQVVTNPTGLMVIPIWIGVGVFILSLGRWFLARQREAIASRRRAFGSVSAEAIASARRRVAAPSCGLLLVGVATMLISLGVVAWSGTMLVRIAQSGSEPTIQQTGGAKVTVQPHSWSPYKPWIVGALVLHAIAAGLGGVVAFAATSMRRLEDLGFAHAGSLLAMLPVSLAWPAGLCVGLWSLLTLSRPEVEAAFDRGEIGAEREHWKPSPSVVLAIVACILGLGATFVPWLQLRIFGFPVTIFGFDVWNGLVAGSLFLVGSLLLVGFEMMSAGRALRLGGIYAIATMIALVLGAYFWEATRDAQETSSTGDEFLRPAIESFFVGNIGGSLMFGPFVSAFAAGLLMACVVVQSFARVPAKRNNTSTEENVAGASDPSASRRFPSLTFWAIVVCVVGLVNSFLPWIIERRSGDSNWLTISDVLVKNRENQIQRHPNAAFGGVAETKMAALATCLLLTLPAFVLFVTAESRRLRWLRTAVMLISGVVWLVLTLVFWFMFVPLFSELAHTAATAAPSVYVSLGLSAALLGLGTLEAKRWLGDR